MLKKKKNFRNSTYVQFNFVDVLATNFANWTGDWEKDVDQVVDIATDMIALIAVSLI